MAYVSIDGLREFNQAIRKATDSEIGKRVAQANKRVGQMVLDRLYPSPDPRATGVGRGATPRASASKREVILRVGDSHRGRNGASPEQTRMQPWGIKRVVPPGTFVPDRPFIAGTVNRHYDEIGNMWLRAVMDALEPAFAERK